MSEINFVTDDEEAANLEPSEAKPGVHVDICITTST